MVQNTAMEKVSKQKTKNILGSALARANFLKKFKNDSVTLGNFCVPRRCKVYSVIINESMSRDIFCLGTASISLKGGFLKNLESNSGAPIVVLT